MPAETRLMLLELPEEPRRPEGPRTDHITDLERLARLADAAGFVVEWELVPSGPSGAG